MAFGLQHLALLLSLAGLCSCTATSGPVVVGQTFLAGTVDPGCDCSAPWALTSHGIAEKLFTVDKNGNIVGQVAQSVSKVSVLVWEVTLKSGHKFSDGTTVTAARVAAALTELNTKNSAARASLGTMNVTASGDLKVRIESSRATHAMNAVLAEWAFVVYYKDTAGNFVFTGPYAIKAGGFAASQIDLIPNTYYAGAAARPLITLKKFSDGNALAAGVKKDEVDIGFHLPIGTLSDVRKVKGQSVTSFEVGYQYMAFHNMDRLGLNVRKAIDLAIDRDALVAALAGGKGTRSLFPDNTPFFSDTSSPKGDAAAAKTLLDAAGWTLDNASGKRMKNGKELNITLVAYPHRPGLVIMQPIIKNALTALGITVTTVLTGQNWAETAKIINDRSFDLLLWAQNTLPAGDPLWFLSNFFRSDAGSNHAHLNSTAVDSKLDALSLAGTQTARVAASAAAQTAILAEVPVSSLMTPFWHVSVSDRMAGYKPWGSDYYVIRSDFATKTTASAGSGVLFHAYPAPYPLTYTSCGVDFTISKAPSRAVTMNQGVTEFMLAMGLADKMVGTAYLDDAIWPQYAEAYANITVLSSGYPTEAAIMGTNADFILGSYKSAFREKVCTDKCRGIFSNTTVGLCEGPGSDWPNTTTSYSTCRPELNAKGIGTWLEPVSCEDSAMQPHGGASKETVYAAIRQIGDVFNVRPVANQLITEIRNDFAVAEQTVKKLPGGTGLKAVWLDCVGCCKDANGKKTDKLFVGAGTGAPNLIMKSAGLTNVFAGEAGSWGCVSISSILAAEPDVMVVVDAAWSPAIKKIEFIHNHSGFCSAKFVQRADYITIPFSASTLGPRNGAAALDMVAAAVHVTTGNVMMDFKSGVSFMDPKVLATKTAPLLCPVKLKDVASGTASTTTTAKDDDDSPVAWILVGVFAALCVVGGVVMYKVGKTQGVNDYKLHQEQPGLELKGRP